MAVPTGELRIIADMGVFIVTAIFSIFAYIWMMIVLVLWSPDKVEIAEAVITLIFFIILITLAFAADKYNAYKKKKFEKENPNQVEENKVYPEDQFKKILGVKQSKDYRLERNKQPQQTQTDIENQKLNENNSNITEIENKLSEMNNKELKNDKSDRVLEVDKPLRKDQSNKNLNRNRKPSDQGQDKPIYSQGVGTSLSGRKPYYNQLKNQSARNNVNTQKNAEFGFNTLKYAIKENKGPLMVKILNKLKVANRIGIRTLEGTATEHEDYEKIDKILEFEDGQEFISIEIGIVDDDIVEPDENFFVELYNPETQESLDGSDTITEVIIIDNDRPGILTFKERLVKVSEEEDYAEVTVVRMDGSDGVVACRYFSREKEDEVDRAKEGIDFTSVDGVVWFEHNEIEKIIKVPILKKGNNPERDDTFELKIEKLSGENEEELFKKKGTHPKFSKKNFCIVEITASLEFVESIEKVKKILSVEDPSWAAQFKQGCMLSPTITEEGIEEVSCLDAVLHFLTIFWKVFFALIPPRQMGGGWPCFVVSLMMIGLLTAFVNEAATVFGCVIGLEPAVTAITFVALGTSLPDTFASKQAAIESKTADAAIGNVTGSNSVNVFLGLGLPWMIATIYEKVKNNAAYTYSAQKLSFSVALYISTGLVCFCVLMLRRKFVGGELGGMTSLPKYLTGILCICLWFIYLIFSILQIHGVIGGF